MVETPGVSDGATGGLEMLVVALVVAAILLVVANLYSFRPGAAWWASASLARASSG